MASRVRYRLALGILIGAVCMGVFVMRAMWEGRSALRAGDEAAESGDRNRAVQLWARAARWYVPGAPHVEAAYERLEDVARSAQDSGDVLVALSAWRAVRGSILATRSFYTPHADRLEPANRAIAQVMAAAEGPGADPETAAEHRVAWHYDLLRRDESPSILWSVVALVGFAIWIGGGVLFAVRGVTGADELAPRVAAVAAVMVAVGLVVWMLGLHCA